MNKFYRIRDSLQKIYESIPSEDIYLIKDDLCDTIDEMQELLDEVDRLRTRPVWLGFIWECLIFYSTVQTMAAYIMRTTVKPGTASQEAPSWAYAAVTKLEDIFKHDNPTWFRPLRENSVRFDNLNTKRSTPIVEDNENVTF